MRLLVILLAFIGFINAAQYANIIAGAKCETLPSTSPCAAIITWPIWLNSTQSITQIDSGIQTLVGYTSVVGAACASAALPYVCGNAYHACQSINDALFPPLQRPLCKPFCQSFVTNCGSILTSFGYASLVPNCDGIDNYYGYENFPSKNITYQIPPSNQTIVLPCNDLTSATFGTNLLVNPAFSNSGANWTSDSGNFTIDSDSRTNGSSVLTLSLSSTSNETYIGANQIIELQQNATYACRFSVNAAFNNTESITPPYSYAACLTLEMAQNLNATVCLTFPPNSTNTYQKSTIDFRPLTPILRATLSLDLNSYGVAQFYGASFQSSEPVALIVPTISTDCPDPLKWNADLGKCDIPCPVPLISGSFYNNLAIAMQFFGWLSFASSVFIIATWILRRRYSELGKLDSSVLYMSICTLGMSVVYGPIFSGVGWDNVICKDPWYDSGLIRDAYADEEPACLIEGVLTYYFSFCFIWWWFYNAVKVWIVVHYPKGIGLKFTKPGVHWSDVLVHVLIWGVGVVLNIAAIFTGNIGAVAGNPQCFVRGGYLPWGSFYASIIFALVVATPLIIKTLYTIYKIRKDAKRQTEIQLYLRFIAFLAFMFVNFVVLFANKLYFDAVQDTLVDEIYDWFDCRVTGGTLESCGEQPQPSGAVLAIQNWLVTAQGVALLLIFVAQRKTFALWWAFLRCQNMSEFGHTEANSAAFKSSFSKQQTKKSENSQKLSQSLDMDALDKSTADLSQSKHENTSTKERETTVDSKTELKFTTDKSDADTNRQEEKEKEKQQEEKQEEKEKEKEKEQPIVVEMTTTTTTEKPQDLDESNNEDV